MVRFAVICASNQNRSMEAHNVLLKNGFTVSSFGTGTKVRLPGPTIDRPNIYPFGTPYNDVYQELKGKDTHLYQSNGILLMLDRNRKIKNSPERFQESRKEFDVIITCEERCFDAVCEDLIQRGESLSRPVHVINVEIKDNYEEAMVGGRMILSLASWIEKAKDVDQEVQDILERFQQQYPNIGKGGNRCVIAWILTSRRSAACNPILLPAAESALNHFIENTALHLKNLLYYYEYAVDVKDKIDVFNYTRSKVGQEEEEGADDSDIEAKEVENEGNLTKGIELIDWKVVIFHTPTKPRVTITTVTKNRSSSEQFQQRRQEAMLDSLLDNDDEYDDGKWTSYTISLR
ncbi:RNA polymerase II subunit A C-terminal domain phosphatase [Lunasporangiospora selenospora]|uniref:protein-serine/threonine phosphatase n=1 Tax=Lunasporangiospora selenospora TaxID=979761 RepID=A0A9P6KEK1_9FUNG|nr:RNA polymerase II subunit A C-terminal domain phosphatase [Lunasporangiospora selenospora]